MKPRNFLFFLLISLVLGLVLTACGGKSELDCELDSDCKKAHFEGFCTDGACEYDAIAGECGNKQCEEEAGENSCTCATDCQVCAGPFEGAKYLKKICNDKDKCVIDVPEVMIKPVSSSKVLKSLGNTYTIITEYNQPFNFKKDTFDVRIILDVKGKSVSDLQISKIELIGTTEDRQTVVLARKLVNKYLRSVNSELIEKLILDLTTGDVEGNLKSLQLKVSEDHKYIAASKKSILKNVYTGIVFTWVKPDTTYDCPTSCDDNNAGTEDICGPETYNFCESRPIPNACGNYLCDSKENACTCPNDCGLCQGPAGEYLDYVCSEDQCQTQIQSGIVAEPKSVFDDRNVNAFHLQNNYKYNSPFNVNTDTFAIDFSLYNVKETVSNVRIVSVKLLDGSNELVSQKIGKVLQTVGSELKVNLKLNDIGIAESEKTLSLTVYYEYTEKEIVKKGSYTKNLGKETLINPSLS